ncbi:MAG TPA: class I SAM-dependent methyltransferase [Verrucomicrobiales bacterium]|jgi:hypothetical protein|nr:class I SAM-dependent methyltransferase [Verrucomicrobiales bacterium]
MEHFYHNIGEPWFTSQFVYTDAVNIFPDGAHFVEVGSWRGRSAAYMAVEIVNSQKFIRFDCVDTWTGSPEHREEGSPFFVRELLDDPDYLYKEFLKNTESVAHIIRAIRRPSLEAVSLYLDRSLDFVFIDAAHDYGSVRADILAWLPKVKRGGVLAGDDYGEQWPGVEKAVSECIGDGIFNPGNFNIHQGTWIYHKRQ